MNSVQAASFVDLKAALKKIRIWVPAGLALMAVIVTAIGWTKVNPMDSFYMPAFVVSSLVFGWTLPISPRPTKPWEALTRGDLVRDSLTESTIISIICALLLWVSYNPYSKIRVTIFALSCVVMILYTRKRF